MSTVLTEERLRLYPAAIFGALVVAFAITLLSADGARTAAGTLGGDFPAFWGAAQLVADGRGAALYSWDAQHAAQQGLHPDAPTAFLAFAYPPFVVLPYLALLPLGFVAGYAAHTLFMGLMLWLTVVVLRPVLPRATTHPFALFVLLLTFFPMLRALFGGQNTALSLVILAGTFRLLHDRRDLLAGAVAGLLLFKPQFGLPLLGLLALRRRPRVLAGAGLTALALYLAGVAVGGWGWIGWWWGQIAQFHQLDQDVNAANSVGLIGVFEAVLGPGSLRALVPGVVLTGALVVGTMVVWAHDAVDPVRRWGLTAVALVLIPPHSMFYDAGLAALALAAYIQCTGRAGATGTALVWTAALSGMAAQALGFNPLFFVLIALGVALWRQR